MFKEIFIGKPLSHFHINPIVKAFVVSEMFLWSAWNSTAPIFAIFAVTHIPGGNTEIAASAFSTHLIVRVVFELISGRYLLKTTEKKKFLLTIIGILLVGMSYMGFAFIQTFFSVFLFSGLSGMGFGIASPAKNSLFSTHLDKNKESVEWGMYDAVIFIGMAFSAIAGGFIANKYGFEPLFIIAAAINMLSILPYILYLNTARRRLPS